ncbi:hypothetical protein SAMN06264365_103467 [Actinoplanes regularis]|uniref:Uncharacterized protein n=1 Tax=Actinoplanes regularis TaxID=52697 RepID=A0A238XJB9_9ACTN|nr:hypothetical protein SAMN06264365_103467 [Actinoplanes regularis]
MDLEPRWRDLARLGWVATRRLTPGGWIPVLGGAITAALWPMTMIDMVASRADHRVAAQGLGASLLLQPVAGLTRRPRYWLAAGAAFIGCLAAMLVPVVVMIIAAAVAYPRSHAVARMLLDWAWSPLLLLAPPYLITVVAVLRRLDSAARARARSRAQADKVPMVEAANLAAHPDDGGAATRLVLRLLAHADRMGMAVLASPRTAVLADHYTQYGFVPVYPGARLMQRYPGAKRPRGRRSRPAQRAPRRRW